MIFSHFRKRAVSLAIAAALLAAAGESLAADAGSSAPPIVIGVGKSRLVELPAPYTDVMIGDPKIADILPLNQHSIYIVGKGMGGTALTVYGAGKRVIYTSDVLV